MSMITFTDSERDLMRDLSIRKMQILQELARLIGSETAETAPCHIHLEDLAGKDYVGLNSRAILEPLTSRDKIIEENCL